MDRLRYFIDGGKSLKGKISVPGSKNETLALLAIATCFRARIHLINIPNISDVFNFLKLGQQLGAEYQYENGNLFLNAENLHYRDISIEDLKKLRASIYYLPILASFKKPFVFGNPGGCALGKRPIDYHLDIMKAFGLNYQETAGIYEFSATKWKATTVFLPFPSFGATVNALMMGCLGRGTTTIVNAAQEPEIIEIIEFIKSSGCDITQVGSTIVLVGPKKVDCPSEFIVQPDRIVAATYISLGLLAADHLEVHHCPYDVLQDYFNFLDFGGIVYQKHEDYLEVTKQTYCEKVSICAEPYPGFSTDILPIIVPILINGRGIGYIKDRVYSQRFAYLEELQKFNANIKIIEGDAIVLGSEKLIPAAIKATDLRGGMAGLLLALTIKGRSAIENVSVLARGYENLVPNLKNLGAEIYEE